MPSSVARDHVVVTRALAAAIRDASARQRLRAQTMRPAAEHRAWRRRPSYPASPPRVPERFDLARVWENAAAQRREAADQRAGAQAAAAQLTELRARLDARASSRGTSTAQLHGQAAGPSLEPQYAPGTQEPRLRIGDRVAQPGWPSDCGEIKQVDIGPNGPTYRVSWQHHLASDAREPELVPCEQATMPANVVAALNVLEADAVEGHVSREVLAGRMADVWALLPEGVLPAPVISITWHEIVEEISQQASATKRGKAAQGLAARMEWAIFKAMHIRDPQLERR